MNPIPPQSQSDQPNSALVPPPLRPPRFLSKMDLAIGAVLVLVIGVVAWLLFSPSDKGILFNDVTRTEHLVRTEGTLTIAYDQHLTTYEPSASGIVTRGYLANLYEGLVSFDRDFNMEPALALSWGMVDDETWEFKLRPNVVFHDGSTFDSDDVVASIDRARTHSDSDVQSLISSIEEIEVIDDLTIQLKTQHPDPTLLNKLTMLWISPSELGDYVPTPIGTGPYSFVRQVGEESWDFERFDSYWGEAPSYPNLTLESIPDKFERYESFLSGDVDVLAQVPPVFVDALLQMGYPIASLPTLEVNFLLFGWEDENSSLRHEDIRKAIVHAFDPEDLIDFTSGYAKPTGQFVSRGVWGYNPDLEPFNYDPSYSRELVDDLGYDEITITLDLPEGLEIFGEYVVEQLEAVGITVELEIWESEAYANWVESGQSEFYFYGWRSELGDAGDFFTNVVHSGEGSNVYGALNNGRYLNEAVDQSIERMDQDVLELKRLEELQELMTFVVEEEIIGVPLFETDGLTAIQFDLTWDPRFDNLILATDFE